MLRASSQGLGLPLPAVCGRSTTLLAQATCRRMGMASQAIRTASSSHHHRVQHQHSSSLARRRRSNDDIDKELEVTGLDQETTPGSTQRTACQGGEDGQNTPVQTTSAPSTNPTTNVETKLPPPSFSLPPPIDVSITTGKSRSHLRIGRSTDQRPPPKKPFTHHPKPRGTDNGAGNSHKRTETVGKVYLRSTLPRHVFPERDGRQADSSLTEAEQYESVRRKLMFILSSSSLPERCWNAYSQLLELPRPNSQNLNGANPSPVIPFALMHRLCRVLASERPVRQSTFIRLHSILTELHNSGGTIHLHEWNALINSTGRGLRRKVSSVEYETAMSFYMDMISGFPPGTTLNRSRYGNVNQYDGNNKVATPVTPDIYTYTSLIHLAARTADGQCFRHACNLLEKSGFLPNRITHLSLIPFFRDTKHFTGLRSTLWKMEAQGLQIGIDGLNAFLSSYAHNGRHDVVMMIYRLLRYNVAPSEDDQEKVQEVAKSLEQEEYIQVPKQMKPNEITYTAVVQSLAYQGRFRAMLTVFLDMVSSPNLDNGPLPPRPDESGVLQIVTYQPTMAVYRAVFMGFARHGSCAREDESGTRRHADSEWNQQNMDKMFDLFLKTPNVRPAPWTAYWILVGCRKTSGGDVAVLQRVWGEMEARFGQDTFGSEARRERLRAHFLHATPLSSSK